MGWGPMDSLTGKSSIERGLTAQENMTGRANEEMRSAYGDARSSLERGYSGAKDAMSEIPGRYRDELNPYASAGINSLNAMQARTAGDPLESDSFNNRVTRAQAAYRERMGNMGMADSGSEALRESGIYDEMAQDELRYQDQLNREMMGMGYNASNAIAGAEGNYWGGLAGLESGYGQNLAECPC